MIVDLNAFVGAYPFRPGPGADAATLLAAMDRVGITEAWVSNASSIGARDPAQGNAELLQALEGHPRLRPVLSVHPGAREWEEVLKQALESGAPAVRCDPTYLGLEPGGEAMRSLTRACTAAGLPLLLAVRLEDVRQRVPEDTAPELEPWALRALVRSDAGVRLIVTHADRDCVEQVHFGSTPAEGERILWDISWLWGPPEDQLALLLRTVGLARFSFGSGMPFRLPETPVARLDLLDLSPVDRAALESGNLKTFIAS